MICYRCNANDLKSLRRCDGDLVKGFSAYRSLALACLGKCQFYIGSTTHNTNETHCTHHCNYLVPPDGSVDSLKPWLACQSMVDSSPFWPHVDLGPLGDVNRSTRHGFHDLVLDGCRGWHHKRKPISCRPHCHSSKSVKQDRCEVIVLIPKGYLNQSPRSYFCSSVYLYPSSLFDALPWIRCVTESTTGVRGRRE